jgi:hypothetical protein
MLLIKARIAGKGHNTKQEHAWRNRQKAIGNRVVRQVSLGSAAVIFKQLPA